jgi:hypothetical protein
VSDDRRQQGVPHAHDGLFRLVFSKPAHAASELRAVLPPELTARLDLERLTPVNGSFVDSALRWRHSDVLLSTRLDGHDALVYVLIEHQSKPDPLMPWRMLRYLVRIWDRHLEDHPKATRLPLIIPVVVHQGHRPWTAPTELSQLIDIDPATAAAAAEFLPTFRYLLDDLARIDPAELQARPLTPAVRLTLLVMHAAPRRTDVTEDLESFLDTIQEAPQPGRNRDPEGGPDVHSSCHGDTRQQAPAGHGTTRTRGRRGLHEHRRHASRRRRSQR